MSQQQGFVGMMLAERYEVLEVLSDSPVELIARAHDCSLEREVMLKFPGRALAATISVPDAKRAMREARALAAVRHPGVVRVFDSVQTSLGPVLVMDPVNGEPLAERLERGKLSAEEARALGIAVAEALAAIHAAGVVHRDVGPSTIVLPVEGPPVLSGFSFAKEAAYQKGATSIDYSSRTRQKERPVALPAYPAPEQLAGQRADARSDVFALGCLLHRCMAGTDPFSAEGPTGPAPDLRKARPDVPKALSEVVRKCLAASPSGRYPTAGELAKALRQTAVPAVVQGPRRGRARLGVAAVALLAGALAIGPAMLGEGGEEHTPRGRPVGNGPAVQARGPAGVYADLYDRSHALLIGIDHYSRAQGWPRLSNPVRDVRRLRTLLEEKLPWEGWEVRTLLNEQATLQGILTALEELENEAGENDRILIYLAGHGAIEREDRDRTTSWFVPWDARSEEEDRFRRSYLVHDSLLNRCRGFAAKHVLFLLDCCYSGRITLVGREFATRSEDSGAAYHLRRMARQVITSSGEEQKAYDDSPFAEALLKVLDPENYPEEHPRHLTARALFVDIERQMQPRLKGLPKAQHPVLGRHPEYPGDAQFLFFMRPE